MKLLNKIRDWNLNRKQADLDRELEKYGMSDELLEKQVEINMKRHEHDLPDKSNINDEGYVQ